MDSLVKGATQTGKAGGVSAAQRCLIVEKELPSPNLLGSQGGRNPTADGTSQGGTDPE